MQETTFGKGLRCVERARLQGHTDSVNQVAPLSHRGAQHLTQGLYPEGFAQLRHRARATFVVVEEVSICYSRTLILDILSECFFSNSVT